MSKLSKNLPTPQQVLDHAVLLGQRLRLARVRRGISASLLANQCGVSRNTISAMELGRPGVAMGVFLTVLWTLGIDKSIASLADPDADTHGKVLEAARRPIRARSPSLQADSYDF